MNKSQIFMGTTKVTPQKTIGEISEVLLRAKARQIVTDYDAEGKVTVLRFAMEVPGCARPVSFRLPCRTEKLAKMIRDKAQTHEVFMPYAVVDGSDGATMFQVWESQMKMLTAGEGAR
jgi:hypothetical protein